MSIMPPESVRIKDLLINGVNDGVFPGAVLVVTKRGRITLNEYAGYLSLVPERIPVTKDTIFDLASLTKPLATTLAVMGLVDKGEIRLDQSLSDLIPAEIPGDKTDITLRQLLNHSGGLKDWKPFYLDLIKHEKMHRKGILRSMILKEPLAYEPGKDSIYSDLGFMILEWIIEATTDMILPDFLERYFYKGLSLKKTFFSSDNKLPGHIKGDVAATEDCPWRGKVMKGIVHDENAYATGGFSGHAGLFSTASEVSRLVNMLGDHYYGKRSDYLRSDTVREFFRRQDIVKGSTWALGWDTPSHENSSSGKIFSNNSVGHLGFSGTSIWMDLDRDIAVVFLTNRVHPTRNNNKIKAFRPRLHDGVMAELGGEASG